MRFTAPYAAAVPALRKALHALAGREAAVTTTPLESFACPVAPEPLALDLWDDETWHGLAARAVTITRKPARLPSSQRADVPRSLHVLAGEFAAASALIEEAYAIAEATGNAPCRYPSLLLAAWRGQEAAALDVIEVGIQDATDRGLERPIGFAQCVTAVLHNGLGRYREASRPPSGRVLPPMISVGTWLGVDELVEAGIRIDSPEVASDALRQLAERTRASGTDWALGIEARSRALLSEGETADRLFREAIERLARTRIRVELTRAHLLYGEWLRREKRRVHAREQLRVAYDAFASMGAEGFAERARRELLATGEKVRKRGDQTRDELTPQENQIARLAARASPTARSQPGFHSPRTVEYHLHKVFTKLEIGSRNQLERALRRETNGAVAA